MKLSELKQVSDDLGLSPIPTKSKILPDGTRTKVCSMKYNRSFK